MTRRWGKMKLLKPFSKNLIVMDLGHLILMSYWNCSKIIRLICRKIRLYKCFKEISLLYKNLKLSSALRMTYKGLRMCLRHKKTGWHLKHNNNPNKIRISSSTWVINCNLNMFHQLLRLWWSILELTYKEKLWLKIIIKKLNKLKKK